MTTTTARRRAAPDDLHGLSDADYLALVALDDDDPVRPRVPAERYRDEQLSIAYPLPRRGGSASGSPSRGRRSA